MNFFKNIYNSFYNIKPTNNLNTFSDETPDATGVAGEKAESPKKTLEKKKSCLWRMPFFQIPLKNVIRTSDYIFQLDNYQYYFFHIFILYNNIVTLKQYVCKSLYNISFIKMIIDIGNVIYKKNYNNMFKIRVEPYMNSWINISIIEKKNMIIFRL